MLRDGAPVIGAGGSPTDCTVPVGGVSEGCHNTCDSTRPDTKIDDPNYKDYKSMEACLELKCLIQVGNCAQDESCAVCMQGEIPEYCFANENFNVRLFPSSLRGPEFVVSFVLPPPLRMLCTDVC